MNIVSIRFGFKSEIINSQRNTAWQQCVLKNRPCHHCTENALSYGSVTVAAAINREAVPWKNCTTYTIIYDCMIRWHLCTPHMCAKILLKSNHQNYSSSYCFLDVKPVFVFVPNYALITLLRNTNSPDIIFSRSQWCNNPFTPYSWVSMWHWWRNYSQKEVICGQLIPVLHLLTICGQLGHICIGT